MAKLVWRVKLVAEREAGVVSETEVACVERDDFAVPETLGLTLDEGKRLVVTQHLNQQVANKVLFYGSSFATVLRLHPGRETRKLATHSCWCGTSVAASADDGGLPA